MSSPPSTGTRTRLPNLVVIGVSKAGTTSLFEYLGRHPDVGLSDTKELRYFTPLRYQKSLGPLEDYAQHFGGLEQRYAVEATPGYFYGGRPLAQALHDTCGPVKVIVSLREPVDRCWSWYRFVKSRLRIPKDLGFDAYVKQCLLLRGQGRDGDLENQAFWGIGGGCYSTWLDDWIEEFGDDLRVVFFDDLVQDSGLVMDELFTWLDLDPEQAEMGQLVAANQTAEYRLGAAQKVAVATNRHGEAFFRRHPRLKHSLRAGYYAINRVDPEEKMSPKAREKLERFFGRYDERLAAQLALVGLEMPSTWKHGSAQE